MYSGVIGFGSGVGFFFPCFVSLSWICCRRKNLQWSWHSFQEQILLSVYFWFKKVFMRSTNGAEHSLSEKISQPSFALVLTKKVINAVVIVCLVEKYFHLAAISHFGRRVGRKPEDPTPSPANEGHKSLSIYILVKLVRSHIFTHSTSLPYGLSSPIGCSLYNVSTYGLSCLCCWPLSAVQDDVYTRTEVWREGVI